jgi:hypothetical protein
VREMTWIKKDVEVLGLVVEENEDEYHYHRNCFQTFPEDYQGKIMEHITKETLEGNPENKLLCDRCGEDIK